MFKLQLGSSTQAIWSDSWDPGKKQLLITLDSFVHIGTAWLKLFCISFRKKQKIKTFPEGPGAQGQGKVPESTEGLAQLSSATTGLEQHRWVVCEVIKCLGRWNDSWGEEPAIANKALNWQRKWKFKLTNSNRNHWVYTTPKCPTILDELNGFRSLQKEANVLTWIST